MASAEHLVPNSLVPSLIMRFTSSFPLTYIVHLISDGASDRSVVSITLSSPPVMAFPAPKQDLSKAASTQRARRTQSDDWECYRPLIGELYLRQKLTHSSVREELGKIGIDIT